MEYTGEKQWILTQGIDNDIYGYLGDSLKGFIWQD